MIGDHNSHEEGKHLAIEHDRQNERNFRPGYSSKNLVKKAKEKNVMIGDAVHNAQRPSVLQNLDTPTHLNK